MLTTSPLLIDAQRSALLVIDLQEKLMPHIADGAAVLDAACWLVDVAREVGVPVMVSEQYPQGLGHSVAALAQRVASDEVATKVHFSCLGGSCLEPLAGFDRAQVVVAGTEAHVCVLQSVLDLQASGRQVFVVAEAVGSRRSSDRQLGLERMRQAGAVIVSREMVAFEWLRQAGTEVFRRVSKTFIR